MSAPGSATVSRRVGQATDEQSSKADTRKSPALQGTNPTPREVDRFGRKIKTTSKDADRGNVKRLKGLPEGTLIALGWGWGGEFRIGTGRDGSESSPRPLHPNFTKKQFVDLAAGKRHTLFVSDDGLVFSVGEGLSWQLGTTSQFTNHPDRRAVQRLPKQVHPSGDLKAGKDYWVAQAAAGDTFSVTREANAEDAAHATEGFLCMKMSVKMLLEQSPSSESLKELWEHILEEERTLHRRFQGRLLSWGSGQRGQLGLGEGVVDRRTPHVIRALAGLPVRSVVAGAAHALCVTLDGKVFSWGCGQDGRLGHGDYKDRWEPCRVEGVGSDPVALIGAGAAHSMAVSLPQSVHLWGRGAHGRLGTGDNKCRHAPVRLKNWPPGFPGCVVQDVALGGAHSIVLAHRSAPTTLANPWGAESLAYAWGYGYCGQLGLGRRVGEIKMPSKIAFDKKELMTSIVAGKSFSLATNVQGQMFAWGKGWAGQLGLGIAKDSRVAPTRVDFPGVGRHLVVKMAAGERHASALTLDCSPPPWGWDKDKQWKKVVGRLRVLCQCGMRPFTWGNSNTNRDVGGGGCGGDGVGIHSRAKPGAGRDTAVGLKGTEHTETGGNICSPRGRRNISPDASAPASPCGLLVSVEDEDDGGDTARWLNHNAVECQRILRGWFGKRLARRRLEEKGRRRREAMEAVWYVTVLGAMEKSIARFDKDEERKRNREGMAAADLESAFYRYYCKLQPVIMALNQQRQALKDFSTREGVTLETLASASDPRVRRGLARRETVTLWSRRDVRQLQRQFPPQRRLPEEKVVLMTVGLPAGGERPKWRSAKGGSSGSSSSGGGEGLGEGTDRIGARGYCGEARGAGRLGGVADPDVDALVRSCQPLIPRRTIDLAGPERLYQRVTRMRASQLHRLSSRRRASFSEGDFAARVDKTVSGEDLRWAQKLGRYWMGVDNSLGATRYLQIGDRKVCMGKGTLGVSRGWRAAISTG
ncbi:conserved unknown protein [Ectocarpus siliculosus]|uniref:Uncharacterized protein n=1 Tax=Ectocarpus siliculosus TaxID=2880 RepID=D7FRD6_ECTSI|nr:conserved unknown protein [Ectocarpus siliculosus]|eukprot:CBJ30727.1 conserved unknown protein [Ectocarpus siliculosus]